MTLGGVAVGSSILGAVKWLGVPDLVQTEDDGHFWQWSRAGGFDREVVTDDDLVVRSVLVARAGPAAPSSPAPVDAPLLGLDADAAARAAAALGATGMHRFDAQTLVWELRGSVLIGEFDGERVVRLRACDMLTARSRGYFGAPLALPVHRAPALLRQYTPHLIPSGVGTVVLRVTVDAQGKVSDARVVVPSGDREVDAFEIQSMRGSTFSPASCAGQPCAGVYIDIGGVMR